MGEILTPLDERVIARQLGRRPRPGTEVCRRCRHNYPQVTATPPVNRRDGRWDMFPTVYWLTCPLLVRAIGQLEAAGWIARYEQRLAEDPAFAAALMRAHAGAAQDRVRRVPPAWREELARDYPRQWQVIEQSGVGGTRYLIGVKCLHAHYADFIARGDNPIGRAVHEQLLAAGVPPDGTDFCWQWCTVEEDGRRGRPRPDDVPGRQHQPPHKEAERPAPGQPTRAPLMPVQPAQVQPAQASPPERWAAIDIGTNSVRLLVADVVDDLVVPVARDLRLTRLGQGVDRQRRLDPAAVERTLAAVGELAARARAAGAREIVVAGTSALRDARDRDEFCRRVEEAHGLPVAVLSGAGEAGLSFMGAVRGLAGGAGSAAGPRGSAGAAADAAAAENGAVWVLDVGGGSTEVVRGTAAGRVLARASADAGAVRMTELCVGSDPIAPADWQRLVDAIRQALAPLWAGLASPEPGHAPGTAVTAGPGFDPAAGHVLVGVGGTITTLAALEQGLDPYDPAKVHGYRLRRAAVETWLDRMRASSVAERRTWRGLQPQRADIIPAGTAIVAVVMAQLGAHELTVSEADLLDGLILWAARHGRDPAYLVDPARERGI